MLILETHIPDSASTLSRLTPKVECDDIDIMSEITIRAARKAHWPLDMSEVTVKFDDDTTFGPQSECLLPPEHIWEAEQHNGGLTVATQTLNVSELISTNDSVNILFSEGLTGSESFSVNFAIPPYFGSQMSSMKGWSFTHSVSNASAITKQHSWNYGINVTTPAGARVRIQLTYFSSLITCPFMATVRIGGRVVAKNPLFESPYLAGHLIGPLKNDYFPVGRLFLEFPHSRVTVVSDSEVTCNVSGTIVGVIGTKLLSDIVPVPA